MNFYKHHLGDYAKATAHLSILEHGVYLLMLLHYYATEAPLPADVAVICRIIRAIARAEVEAVRSILDQFWTPGPHGWTNGRGTEEIERATRQREINTELGKRGGRPRKTDSVSDSVSEQEPNGKPNRNPSHYPLTNNQKSCVSELGKESGFGTHRKPAAERHRDAVAIADEYAKRAIAADLEGSLQRTHEVAVSPGVDIAVVNAGRIRTAAG